MKLKTLLEFIENNKVNKDPEIFFEINEDISSVNGMYFDHDGDLIVGKYEQVE